MSQFDLQIVGNLGLSVTKVSFAPHFDDSVHLRLPGSSKPGDSPVDMRSLLQVSLQDAGLHVRPHVIRPWGGRGYLAVCEVNRDDSSGLQHELSDETIRARPVRRQIYLMIHSWIGLGGTENPPGDHLGGVSAIGARAAHVDNNRVSVCVKFYGR
jgi:hypothetical protein